MYNRNTNCDAFPKITNLNGFRAVSSLKRASYDERIQEIEGNGMDEGRVFIHLVAGYWFGAAEGTTCYSVGSVAELRYAISLIEVRK